MEKSAERSTQSVERSATEPTDVARRVSELVDEAIAGTNVFVVEVEVRGSHGSRVVDIYVDSDEDLAIDRLAEISREVSFLLDVEDVIPGRYSLNVSSPGLDRPLRLPRQYRKNIGRSLRVHYQKPDGSGATETVGTLRSADEDAIELDVANGDARRIPLDDVVWAKVQLPW